MAIVLSNNLLPIQTVAPQISIGEIMISADKRSSNKSGKEEKLTDAERIRRVVLPAGHWQELAATINSEKSQQLTDVLREALRRIASDRLRDVLAESPLQQTVPAADFTIANLLAWSEETASSRGSITFTREQVEAWFKDSATKQQLLVKWQEAGKNNEQQKQLAAFASNRFAALAAKNHGLKSEEEADKLMTLIAPADAETGIGADIVGRIAHIQKALAAKAAEATISMDDL